MNDKSLIYTLFEKFLDSPEEESEETKDTPEDTGYEAADGAGTNETGPDRAAVSRRSREEEESREEGAPVSQDHRVETVEDWNEEERRRQEGLFKALNGGDGEDREAEGESDSQEEEESVLAPPEEYRDAEVEITVSNDRMAVSVMLIEPSGGGEDITENDVYDALEAENVTYGLDEEKINTMVEKKQYRQMFIAARGTPPVDGDDGRIKDYFPREAKLKYATRENGGIDFKSMNLIHNVKKGEVVCEITMPTEPKDGINVSGQPVRGKNGTMPPIPQGKNVVYSPERDKLVTACEGNLTFRSGRFQVENVFSVAGNVDNSVGNIDFTGSVTIRGDVFEGFTVKAKGDITVMGIVEGAVLKAGGNILLHKGMRGMKSGVLEAEGDITAKFLEDCTIYAKNNIQAEYIINSEVSCGHDLTLIGKRGAFIGGSCAVYNQMNVKTVGASSHITTTVTLGMTPQLMAEVERISGELVTASRKQAENTKDVTYLTGKLKDGTITPRQQERLTRLKLEAPVNALKEKKLKQQVAELARQLREVGRARLSAGEVHPGTVINIGDCKMSISKREESCSFYYLDGEIRKGIR